MKKRPQSLRREHQPVSIPYRLNYITMQIKDSVVIQSTTRIRPTKTVKLRFKTEEPVPFNMKGSFTIEQALVGILMDAGEKNQTLPRKYAIFHVDSSTYFDITTNILGKRLSVVVSAQKADNPMEKMGAYECEFDHNDGILVIDACFGVFHLMAALGGQI